jgi:predicted O-methyltransferase YrrM
MTNYKFTNSWFESTAKNNWDQLIPSYIQPKKILEIGSYEGASACYLIERLAIHNPIEIHCVDTWEGGVEHKAGGMAQTNMQSVESRFLHNTQTAINKVENRANLYIHKGYSDICLANILSGGKQGYFDLVYIDGSHQAHDVICDAILGFKLLANGGVMIFDDYLWYEELDSGRDILRCPKPAIDAFINIFFRKINIIRMPLYQIYIQKISD